ncbi:MAG: DUF499 domain-containing protein [Chloroflexi bacterium]|nr:DUF499 domain-containing protein [Chloroflexota bacterium]
MIEGNHAALGRGLKLYTDAMRRFVQQRLTHALAGTWWDQGVLPALTRGQATNVRHQLRNDPDIDRIDLIDANLLVRVITQNFDLAFAEDLHNFRQTQSWLLQVAETRNRWAHPRSGDMSADEVGHALYAIVQLLRTSRLPEHAEVEAIRRQVLGIASETLPSSVTLVRPASQGELPYWWQVCKPRTGFRDPAHIDESLFAATLGGVFAGSARHEYLDPQRFLSHTFFTENLRQMIRDIASRICGGSGPAVTEIQTPFGGGKTHALLTLYHLINDPNAALTIPAVRAALGDARIPTTARVLVFDGQEAGAEPAIKQDGTSVATLWGELAYQVDADSYGKVRESDKRGDAPGNAVFRQVLEHASPCLILLDELVSYLVKLRFSTSQRFRNLYRQTVQFLQETLQLASNVSGACVLIALPKSRREFGGLDPQQLQRELAVLEDLQPRADRVVSKRTPVNDAEIYVLMRTRLFEQVDPKAADRISNSYQQIYMRTPDSYDPAATTTEYATQQRLAYPLHPELIDVLYKKWSTAPDFPRTRATLQLLASVVADQWSNRREAYTIQSSHVNLERERIRTRVVSAAGGGGYDGVVAADIVGGNAHADLQDQRRGSEYQRQRISRGVATTLLMHSFGGRERSGATVRELRIGTVAPNIGPEYVTEILDSLEQSLWYVHRQGERLRFQTRPNVYRVIAQQAESLPTSIVAEHLRRDVEAAVGGPSGFRVLAWAGDDGRVPDSPEPTVAVLPPRFAGTDDGGSNSPDNARQVRDLWDHVGAGLRQWRNALILVAPDRELWDRADGAVREVLGYESVLDSANRNSFELSQPELRELKTRGRAKRDSLRTSVVTAYRYVFYPTEQGLKADSLPIPATAGEQIAVRVVQRLTDQYYGSPKVLPKMGAIYFNSKVSSGLWKDRSEPLNLSEALRRFPQWTFLPLLPNREETLRACIREGVSQKLWAVAIGDDATALYQDLIETPDALDKLEALFDGSASLVADDLLIRIRENLTPGTGTDTPNEVDDGCGTLGVEEESPQFEFEHRLIPPPTKRLARVRLNVAGMDIAKTSNLQPYLFRVLQEQDAGAEVNITIDVSSSAGIPRDALDQRIVEAFEQLGIDIDWEEA